MQKAVKSAREYMKILPKKQNNHSTLSSSRFCFFFFVHTNWHNYLHSDIDSIRIACGKKVMRLITRISGQRASACEIIWRRCVTSIQPKPFQQVVFDIQHFFFFHSSFTSIHIYSLQKLQSSRKTYEVHMDLPFKHSNKLFRSLVLFVRQKLLSCLCSLFQNTFIGQTMEMCVFVVSH